MFDLAALWEGFLEPVIIGVSPGILVLVLVVAVIRAASDRPAGDG